MKKIRVLLLTNGKLPIPAVKGGAIETLLSSLIEENEAYKRLEITVISRSDIAINNFNQSHQFTKVIPVETKEKKLRWFIQKFLSKTEMTLTKKKNNLVFYPELIEKTKSFLKENPVDCVIDLNCPERIPVIRSFFTGNLAVYLHNDYLNCQTKRSKEILDNLNGVISVCDFLNDQVRKIPYAKKLSTFYRVNNGIDLRRFQPAIEDEKKQIRLKLDLGASDCVILFSGRITETKGLHLLFNALEKIDDLSNVKVLVCGGITHGSTKKDSYLKKVMLQAEKLPVEVIFTGYIEKEKIPLYLKAADICAIPSTFHETCCLTAVEAQAIGIPVIATNIGGIPEYISKKSALLIDYNQSFFENFTKGLDRLIHDQSFREQLSKEAIKKREQHSQERYYEEFVEVVKQVVKD